MNALNVSALIQFLQTATPTVNVDLSNILIHDDDDNLFGIALLGSLVAQHPQGGEVRSEFWVDLILDPTGTKQPYIILSDTCIFKSNGITVIDNNGSVIHKPIEEIDEVLNEHNIWDKFSTHENLQKLETAFFNEVKRKYNGDLSLKNVKSHAKAMFKPV